MLLSMSTSTKIVVPIYKKVSIQKVERLHVQMTVCQWVRKSHKTHSPLGARARCIYIKNFFFYTVFKKLKNITNITVFHFIKICIKTILIFLLVSIIHEKNSTIFINISMKKIVIYFFPCTFCTFPRENDH